MHAAALTDAAPELSAVAAALPVELVPNAPHRRHGGASRSLRTWTWTTGFGNFHLPGGDEREGSEKRADHDETSPDLRDMGGGAPVQCAAAGAVARVSRSCSLLGLARAAP